MLGLLTNFKRATTATTIAVAILVLSVCLLPRLATALDCSSGGVDAGTTACSIQGGVNSAAGGTDTSSAPDSLHNTLVTVINLLSLVVGIIAVIVIIIAGLNYVTSGGDDNKTATAKKMIINAAIGLVIVAFAQIIVQFVINESTNPSSLTTPPTSSGGACQPTAGAPSCH